MMASDGFDTAKASQQAASQLHSWKSIVMRARSLDARSAAANRGSDIAVGSPVDAGMRRRWCAAAARGIKVDFLQRIDRLGLAEPDELAYVLGEFEEPEEAIPDWFDVLISASSRCTHDALQSCAEAGHELDGLVRPLLDEAMVRLTAQKPMTPEVNDGVIERLVEWLRRDLSRVMAPAVDTELAIVRTRTSSALSDGLWARFESEATASGLFLMWSAYPVLARLVGVRVLHWVERCAEFLRRFDEDSGAIADWFGIGGPMTLDAVEVAESEPHNCHAGVIICTTTAGNRFVYKAKDLSADAFWCSFVWWANDNGFDLGSPCEVLDRGGYGWTQFVVQSPAASDEARRFYNRIGQLAAVLFALGGNDAHAENVVAHGDTPVLIDTETILQPTLPAESNYPAAGWVHDGMLLPRWLRVGRGVVDMSATGAPGSTWISTALKWKAAGTSGMELLPAKITLTDFPCAVRSPSGELYRPESHADHILSGFRQGWNQIRCLITDFTARGGWLDRIGAVQVRVLLRMTRTYTRLLETSTDPMLLGSGIERSIHLDHVTRIAFDRSGVGWFECADSERRMLEDGDVPYFSVRADAESLMSGDGSEMIRFQESSVARARRRLTGLDDDGLASQSNVIRASLAVAPADCRLEMLRNVCSDSAPSVTADVTTAVRALAERVCKQINIFGGPSAPLSLIVASPSQWAVDVASPGLYDGCMGIACALATAAAATRDSSLSTMARDVAQSVVEDAWLRPRRLVLTHGLGGQNGVGGMLLGLAFLQQLAGEHDSELESAFLSLSSSVIAEDLDRADPLDLLSGLPGLVAGVCAGTQHGWYLDAPRRDAMSHRLIDAVRMNRAMVEAGDTPPMNGFSHGDAGLAVVLAGVSRFGGVIGDDAGTLSAQLIAAESARFDPLLEGWPDYRSPVRPLGQGPGWCNGSPGIGLSRFMIAKMHDGSAGLRAPGVRDHLAVDLNRSQPGFAGDRVPRDTLCCGKAGRVAILGSLLACGGNVCR